MKKIIIFLIIILMSISIKSLADDININYTNKIELKNNESDVIIEIRIQNNNPYAGAEFGIQCPDGVSIKDVIYSTDVNKTAVTKGQGIYWFSYFSGTNSYKGEIVASVILDCAVSENTSVVIDNISIYTKNGANVDSYNVRNRDIIKIISDGANNEIKELEPPKELVEFNIMMNNKKDDKKDVVSDNKNIEIKNDNNTNLGSIENKLKDVNIFLVISLGISLLINVILLRVVFKLRQK